MRECVIHGVMVSIAAFQADDPGSIPAWGSIFLGLHSNTESLFPIFHQHGHILPKKILRLHSNVESLFPIFHQHGHIFPKIYWFIIFIYTTS